MKLVRGFVQDVITKGSEEKPYAVVGIDSVSKDRDGFDQTTMVKFMIAGQQFKDGLQNAYRQLKGSEVFAPYTDEIDYFNNKARIRYNLTGIPVRLQDAQRERPAAAPTSTPAPQQTAVKTA